MPPGAFIASRDVKTGGSKMYTAFKSTQTFEEYTARMAADCRTPHLHEILLASDASWLYSDLDYTSRAHDPQNFLERRQHLHHLLEHFCTHIMQLPPSLLQPLEVAASHGALSTVFTSAAFTRFGRESPSRIWRRVMNSKRPSATSGTTPRRSWHAAQSSLDT